MSSVFKIEEIGKVLTGKTPKTSVPEFWDGVLPFYTPSDMDGRRRLDEVKRYITEDGLKTVKNSAIPPNSVMVSCIGSDMGKVSLSVKHGVTNQQINTIIPNEDVVDHLYLYYSLLPRKSELQLLASGGSAQPILNKRQFSKLKVVVPPHKDQKAITHILGTLDDKIELNQKMNQTLEDIAKAIFKSWFVDFDPVRAKAEGRPTGLPSEISDLFPDGLVDSEIGEIPRGWGLRRLDSILELAYGKSLPAKNRLDGEVPVYGSGGVNGFHNEPLVEGASIVVGRKGTVGSLYWVDKPFFPIDTVFYVRTEESIHYCFYLMQTLRLETMNTDAAVPGLNRDNAYRLQVPNAPTTLVNHFSKITKLTRDRISIAEQENKALSELRDILLPKLISGELRIPDAEKFLEEAGI